MQVIDKENILAHLYINLCSTRTAFTLHYKHSAEK